MGGRGRRIAAWVAAAILVPVALAGVGLLWVRPADPGQVVVPAPGPASATAAPAAGPATVPPAVTVQSRVDVLLAATPLQFDGESAALRRATADAARRVAELLVGAPELRVRLVGHTADLPGPPDRALGLSRDRAAAIAGVLTAAGVDAARLRVEGAGDAAPLATPEASRRVEIAVEG